jgi:DNA-directed RNA polymerase II subunit RPB1
MTHRGSLTRITRHGINRADTGVEEMVEILMDAAAVGEEDDCHGIAENVMFGQLVPMGTGAFLALISAGINNSIMADQPHEPKTDNG